MRVFLEGNKDENVAAVESKEAKEGTDKKTRQKAPNITAFVIPSCDWLVDQR